jgi:phospholipase/carboxylesterase
MQEDLSLTTEIKLYYDLYVPENATDKLPLLFSIHGYGANKRYMMREAQKIADDKFVIASLQAPNQHFRPVNGGFRVGFGWLTDYKSEEAVALHHKFILDVIEKLTKDGLIDENEIYLYGFSQACALNFRFAFTNSNIVRGVIGLCGGIPSDLETSEIYKPLNADVLYLYGDNDEFYTLEKFQDYNQRLSEKIANYTSKLYQAKHEITDEMREDVKRWLKEKSGK